MGREWNISSICMDTQRSNPPSWTHYSFLFLFLICFCWLGYKYNTTLHRMNSFIYACRKESDLVSCRVFPVLFSKVSEIFNSKIALLLWKNTRKVQRELQFGMKLTDRGKTIMRHAMCSRLRQASMDLRRLVGVLEDALKLMIYLD